MGARGHGGFRAHVHIGRVVISVVNVWCVWDSFLYFHAILKIILLAGFLEGRLVPLSLSAGGINTVPLGLRLRAVQFFACTPVPGVFVQKLANGARGKSQS